MNLLALNTINDCNNRIKEIKRYRDSLIRDAYNNEVLENFVQEMLDVGSQKIGSVNPYNSLLEVCFGTMIVCESYIKKAGETVITEGEGFENQYELKLVDPLIPFDIVNLIEEGEICEDDFDGAERLGSLPKIYAGDNVCVEVSLYDITEYGENGYYYCDYFYTEIGWEIYTRLYSILKKRQPEVQAKLREILTERGEI